MSEIKFFKGGVAVDDRGAVSFVNGHFSTNSFDLTGLCFMNSRTFS